MALLNPLPECPHATNNCNRQSLRTYLSAEQLFKICKQVTKTEKPHKVYTDNKIRQIDAVFRIPLFGFKDNFTLLVVPLKKGSIVHMRSASRIGYYDFGVNRRRVNRIRSHIYQKTLVL